MRTSKHDIVSMPFVQSIASAGRSVDESAQVLLYGSRARGDARPDSDWDVLVVLDKPRVTMKDREDFCDALTAVGIANGAQVSVAVYTADHVRRHSFFPFFQEVKRDGIRLT